MSRLPCGCTYEGERWLKLCEPHEAEWRIVHERWAREHGRTPQPELDAEIADLLS